MMTNKQKEGISRNIKGNIIGYTCILNNRAAIFVCLSDEDLEEAAKDFVMKRYGIRRRYARK